MTYLDLINNFWRCDEHHSFNGNETRLYFYLLNVANALGWSESFWHTNEKVMANVGIKDEGVFKSHRNRLKQAGLIDFEAGNGRGQKTRYVIKGVVKGEEKYTPLATPLATPPLKEEVDKTRQENTEWETADSGGGEKASTASKNTPAAKKKGEPSELNVSFEEFWNAYDKKTSPKDKCSERWAALSDVERLTAMKHIPEYIRSQPEKQYRKDPLSYLNQKAFNNEIIQRGSHANNGATRSAGNGATPARGTGTINDLIAIGEKWGIKSTVTTEPNVRQAGS